MAAAFQTMSENLITVASYSNPAQAHLARGMLEAHEIPAFLADEHTVSLYWLYSNAIGGVKLRVLDSDVPHARRLLGLDSPSGQAMMDNDDGRGGCLDCGSYTTEYASQPGASLLSVLLLGIPLLFAREKRRCAVCGRARKF